MCLLQGATDTQQERPLVLSTASATAHSTAHQGGNHWTCNGQGWVLRARFPVCGYTLASPIWVCLDTVDTAQSTSVIKCKQDIPNRSKLGTPRTSHVRERFSLILSLSHTPTVQPSQMWSLCNHWGTLGTSFSTLRTTPEVREGAQSGWQPGTHLLKTVSGGKCLPPSRFRAPALETLAPSAPVTFPPTSGHGPPAWSGS